MTVSRLVRGCAYVAAGLLGGVAAFQLLVAGGAPWGQFTQGGQSSGALSSAGRIVAAVSTLIVWTFALAILARIGRGPFTRLNRRAVAALAWVAVGYSALAIVLNAASRSVQERSVWVPVTLVLFATSLIAVRGTRPNAK